MKESAPTVQSPWKLDRGVYFEDVGLLVSWGTPFDELEGLGAPEVQRQARSVRVCWSGRRLLGGLEGTVSACRILEPPNPRAFHIYLPDLHWFSVRLSEHREDPAAAQRQLRRIHDRVVSAIGPATFSYPDYSRKLPGVFWERPPLRVALGPVYGGTALQLSVSHTAPSHAELQASADRIRAAEGEGARVDYVAWHAPFD
jgi:hypothetical protein